jgi:hypothetical protein
MFYDLSIAELSGNKLASIRDAITSIEVSWSIDAVSEVTFEIWDSDYRMINANYFQIRRGLTFNGAAFEIASMEVTSASKATPIVKIEARRTSIQRMKRDKNPQAYGGGSATDYARAVAGAFGLNFVGQPTDEQAAQIQSNTGGRADSVWDVLKRNAGAAQFAVFESDNTLYFASEEWLLGKWANLSFNWPTFRATDPFLLYQIPNCRTSDDDPKEAEIRCVVDRTNAVNLRPGMTVNFNGINGFNGPYLISLVSYTLEPMDPVSVTLRTPVKPEPRV